MSYLVLALSKGRLFPPTVAVLKQMGMVPRGLEDAGRLLTFDLPERKLRVIISRATDVPTYVEHGVADIGIVGSDLLMEQVREVYAPVDLGFGRCAIVLAQPSQNGAQHNGRRYTKLKVATKYTHITESYFSEKGIPIEIIKLYGSIELAPSLGLADQIVDLTASGETLRAHHLVVTDKIAECSARLIVNRASLKLKYPGVKEFIKAVADCL